MYHLLRIDIDNKTHFLEKGEQRDLQKIKNGLRKLHDNCPRLIIKKRENKNYKFKKIPYGYESNKIFFHEDPFGYDPDLIDTYYRGNDMIFKHKKIYEKYFLYKINPENHIDILKTSTLTMWHYIFILDPINYEASILYKGHLLKISFFVDDGLYIKNWAQSYYYSINFIEIKKDSLIIPKDSCKGFNVKELEKYINKNFFLFMKHICRWFGIPLIETNDTKRLQRRLREALIIKKKKAFRDIKLSFY